MRTAATQDRSHADPQVAARGHSYKSSAAPTRRTTPVPCRSKLCLRTAATRDRSHADPQVAARGHSYTKAAPVRRTGRTTPVPCRSKLCLRTAATQERSHADPRVAASGRSYTKQRASRKARRVNNRPAVPALFSGRKKTSNFVGGGGSSRSKSGPLGRGPEICQHLTQQGASKGFYTLRSLRPICCSASSMRMEIFFLQTPTLSPAAAGTVASRAIVRLPG